jgi:aspartate ammonia-lyase
MATRSEHDFLGDLDIDERCYYGVQTARAVDNFHITGLPMSSEPEFIAAFAMVKKAAALANRDCGTLSAELAGAIAAACDRLMRGEFVDQFPTDLIQGGAGTSCNMNVNEVIANVALEAMGRAKGDYDSVHPNNHVNCSQSTNDAYPTAFRLALHAKIASYVEELERLAQAMEDKGKAFAGVLKMGRTQLQDAVPMSLGDEFRGWSVTLREDVARMREAQRLLVEVNMGATAIGTGINAPPGYAEACVRYLAAVSGVPVVLSADLIEATSDTGAYVQLSGTLKRSALKISKICNDLRLLSSGPRAGFGEINLPRLQPGSSIMPGKVNPVIPEVVNQTAYYVVGMDVTVSMAAEAGQLQLNVMEPVIAFALFTSLRYLQNACLALRTKCVEGITANPEVCRNQVMGSIGIVTALNPLFGYEACAAIAKEALQTGKSLHQIVVIERQLLTQARWDEIFSIDNLIRPRFIQS